MSGPNQSFTADEITPSFLPDQISLGFRPKVVFCTGAGVDSARIGAGFVIQAWAGFGWSADPTLYLQSSVGSGGFQNGNVSGGSYISESVFAGMFEYTNTRTKQIDMISFDCDTSPTHVGSGFTWQTSPLSMPTQVVPTIALGGDNISVAAGSFSWPGAAGDYAVTGVGFTPQLVMFLWCKESVYNMNFPSGRGAGMGFGAASGSGADEQFGFYSMSGGGISGVATFVTGKVCYVNYNAPIATGTLASMDTDGFTVSFDGPDTGETFSNPPRLVGWIALADSQGGFKVGHDVVPGGTGNQAYTGCGFAPDQVITAHANTSVANSFYAGDGSFGFGMFDDALQSATLSGEGLIGAPHYSARYHDSRAIVMSQSFTGVINGQADRASMDADGFTLNWTNAGAPGKPFGWIAMHTTGGNAPCGTGGFIGQIYRRLQK